MHSARGRYAGAFVAVKMVTTKNLDTSALSSSSQHGRVVMQFKTLCFYFWTGNVKVVYYAVGAMTLNDAVGNVTRSGCVCSVAG